MATDTVTRGACETIVHMTCRARLGGMDADEGEDIVVIERLAAAKTRICRSMARLTGRREACGSMIGRGGPLVVVPVAADARGRGPLEDAVDMAARTGLSRVHPDEREDIVV